MILIFSNQTGSPKKKWGCRKFLQGKVFGQVQAYCHLSILNVWNFTNTPSSKLEYLPFFKFFSHVFFSRSFTPGSSLATELRKSTEDLRRQDFMTKPLEKKPSEVSQLTSQNDPNNICCTMVHPDSCRSANCISVTTGTGLLAYHWWL